MKEENPQDETVYRIPSTDVSALSPDFIRDDVSRVFFCFYRLKPEQYDDGKAQEFADAFFINGNSLKNGKLKLELNINMPVRVDGNTVTVDRSMMAEILTHELTHAYRKSKEFAAGHYKWSFPGLDFFKRKIKNRKYTTTERARSYIRTLPDSDKDNEVIQKMKWIGYTMVEDEMYANLNGTEVFLASGGKIDKSRGKEQVDIIKKYITYVKKNATKDDWEKCMKEISYIPARKEESVARFSRRWIAYYKDRIERFYEKVDKLKEKYSNKNGIDKFRLGKEKIIIKGKNILKRNLNSKSLSK